MVRVGIKFRLRDKVRVALIYGLRFGLRERVDSRLRRGILEVLIQCIEFKIRRNVKIPGFSSSFHMEFFLRDVLFFQKWTY